MVNFVNNCVWVILLDLAVAFAYGPISRVFAFVAPFSADIGVNLLSHRLKFYGVLLNLLHEG